MLALSPSQFGASAAQKTRLFISYSRADIEFADRLVVALEARGYEVLIDRRNLPTLEDWRRELLVLIRKADTVIFIVSSRSIASPQCQWEVEEMAALDKRLAPIVLERVANDKIPTAVSRINYLFFDPPNDFETQADALARALKTDIAWWHEHTRLVDLASRWHRDGRPEELLLRRGAITAVKSWVNSRPDDAQIPDVVFQFLNASHEGDAAERLIRVRLGIEMTQRAVADGQLDHAIRLMAAGALLADDVDFVRVPELWFAGVQAIAEARVIAAFSGHDRSIETAAFSPDGKRVVTASADGTARVWDADTAQQLAVLERPRVVRGRNCYIKNAQFSPDGTRVVTTTNFGGARLWNAENGRRIATLSREKRRSHTAIAMFSQDGSRIVAIAGRKRWWFGGTARLFQGVTGKLIGVFRGHWKRVTNVTISPDGTRVATISDDMTARIWDTASQQQIAVLRGHKRPLIDVLFSPDGSHLLTTSWLPSPIFKKNRRYHRVFDGTRVWNVANGQLVAVLKGSEVAFTPDSACIIVDGGVWDIASRREIRTLDGLDSWRQGDLSPDGCHFIAYDYYGQARIWDVAAGRELSRASFKHNKKDREYNDRKLKISPDGQRGLTLSANTAYLWDLSRVNASTGDRAVSLTAALAHGVGIRTEAERDNLLLQDAPEDLFMALKERIPERASAVARTIAEFQRIRDVTIAQSSRPAHSSPKTSLVDRIFKPVAGWLTALSPLIVMVVLGILLHSKQLPETAIDTGFISHNGELGVFREKMGKKLIVLRKDGNSFRTYQFEFPATIHRVQLCDNDERVYILVSKSIVGVEFPSLYSFHVSDLSSLSGPYLTPHILLFSDAPFRCGAKAGTVLFAAPGGVTSFDVASSKVIQLRGLPDQPLHLLGFFSSGVALASSREAIFVLEPDQWKITSQFSTESPLWYATFHQASGLLLNPIQDGKDGIAAWEVGEEGLMEKYRIPGSLLDWKISEKSSRLTVLDVNNRLTVYELRTGAVLTKRDGVVDVSGIFPIDLGRKVVLIKNDARVDILDLKDSSFDRGIAVKRSSFDRLFGATIRVRSNDSGAAIVTQLDYAPPVLWSADVQSFQRQLGPTERTVTYVGLSPDGRYVFTGDSEGSILVYYAHSGDLVPPAND